jgi:hypothetical protein
MDENTKKILDLLSEYDLKTKMKVITECVSKIGTEEWRDRINDIIKKIEITEN